MNAQYDNIGRIMRVLPKVPNAISTFYFEEEKYPIIPIIPNVPKNQKGEYEFGKCKDIMDTSYWYLFRQGFILGTEPVIITDTSISFPNQEKSKAFDIHKLFPQSPYYRVFLPTLFVPIKNLSNKKMLIFMRCSGGCMVGAMSQEIPPNTLGGIRLGHKYTAPCMKRHVWISDESLDRSSPFSIDIYYNFFFHDINVIPKLPKRVFKNLYLQRILRRTQNKMIFYLQAFGLPTKFKPLQYLKA